MVIETINKPNTDESDTTDGNKIAHIVLDKNKVTEAYIYGTPIEALCGYTWVPSRDPKRLPICEKCKEEFKNLGGTNVEGTDV